MNIAPALMSFKPIQHVPPRGLVASFSLPISGREMRSSCERLRMERRGENRGKAGLPASGRVLDEHEEAYGQPLSCAHEGLQRR